MLMNGPVDARIEVASAKIKVIFEWIKGIVLCVDCNTGLRTGLNQGVSERCVLRWLTLLTSMVSST